jgi:hypothetical protein
VCPENRSGCQAGGPFLHQQDGLACSGIKEHDRGIGRNAKMRNPLEILQISGEDEGIMDEGNGSHLEIHCPDTNALLTQPLERLGCLIIKWDDLPA